MNSFFLIFSLFTQPIPEAAPSAPETLSKAQIEEGVFHCQMDMLSPSGALPDAAPCICRGKFGLPETEACRILRAPKGKGK